MTAQAPGGTNTRATGIGDHIPPAFEQLNFARVPIREALAGVGAQPQDVDIVINCRLHADHAGGNVHFPGARA